MSRRRRKVRSLIICVVVGYLVLVTFGGCADKLVLAPSTNQRDSHGASRRTIPFQNGVLEIWTARSAACNGREPEAYLLEFCGNGTRAEDIATYVAHRWNKHPVEVWAVNYPGYGGSTGPAKLNSIPRAALCGYDALGAIAKPRPIFTGGHSLGTAPALYVAANRNVTGLFLHNPPALRQVIMGGYGWWNLWLAALPVSMQIPNELDSRANAAHVQAPAVFITALSDDYVPPKYHRMVIDAYGGPKRIIELQSADHNTPPESPEVDDAVEWLWNNRHG